MIYLTATRFNDDTWKQNCLYREKKNIVGCIYGVPKRISEDTVLNSEIIVIEMNNDRNEIMGIGIVRNYLRMDKHFKIYKDGNYNRFTYKSGIRIDRENFTNKEMLLIKAIEQLIFYGSTHIKRGQGISKIPDKLLGDKKKKLIKNICKLFTKRFISTTSYRDVMR